MKTILYVFGFLLFNFEVLAIPTSTYFHRSDTIRIDPELLQGDTNYTILNYFEDGITGELEKSQRIGKVYPIGDTVIHLDKFKKHVAQRQFTDLSFDKKITTLAVVSTRGYREAGSDYGEDTTLIKGQLKDFKRAKKIPINEIPYSEPSFRNNCPPSVCGHYYVAIDKKRDKVEVRGPHEFNKLIPSIQNPTDAFFMIDDRVYQKGIYQLVGDGYLILVNKVVSDCKVKYADLLYHVSLDGKTRYIGQNITQITNLCY